jgi:hypothetical protein
MCAPYLASLSSEARAEMPIVVEDTGVAHKVEWRRDRRSGPGAEKTFNNGRSLVFCYQSRSIRLSGPDSSKDVIEG